MATDDIEWEDDGIEWEGDAPATPAKRPTTPLLERVATGFNDLNMGIGQMLGQRLIDEEGNDIGSVADLKKMQDKQYVAPEGMDWGRMAGNALNPMNWAGGRVATGMQGFAAPTEQEGAAGVQERLVNAGTGLLMGEAGRQLIPRALRAFRPGNADRAANLDVLTARGVQPTVSQTRGQGVISTIENASSRVPGLGKIIVGARNRPLQEAHTSFIEQAIGDVGATAGRIPKQQVRAANEYVTDLYRQAEPYFRIDNQGLQQTLDALRNQLGNSRINDRGRAIIQDQISEVTDLMARGGARTPQEIQQLGTNLARESRDAMRSADPADRTLSLVLADIRNGYVDRTADTMRRVGYTEAADTMLQANNAYRNMIPINSAASKNVDRFVYPDQYARAIAKQRHTDPSRLGGTPREDFVNAALETLPQRMEKPPSLGVPGSVGFGVGVLSHPVAVGGIYGAGLGTAAALYPRAAQRILTGSLRNIPGQQEVVNPTVAALRGGMYDTDGEESAIQQLLRQQEGDFYAP